jgi:hypothetical protein
MSLFQRNVGTTVVLGKEQALSSFVVERLVRLVGLRDVGLEDACGEDVQNLHISSHVL